MHFDDVYWNNLLTPSPSVFNERKPSFVTKHTAVDESECVSEGAGEHGTDDSMQSGLDISKLPQGESSVKTLKSSGARGLRGALTLLPHHSQAQWWSSPSRLLMKLKMNSAARSFVAEEVK